IADGIPGNMIGGTALGSGNVIAANGGNEIFLNGVRASNNVVQGNFLGVDATASRVLGSPFSGVAIDAGRNNLIGGAAPGAGNVIGGNDDGVILLSSAALNPICG